VVVQVALGLLLLVSSGLFVRSARHGLTIDSGFREERLLLLSLDLDILGYEASEGRAFYRDLQEALRGAAGVEAAGLASGPPLQGYPGLRVAPAEADVAYGSPLSVTRVGDGFLDAAGVDLLSGRPLRESDMGGTTQVALLNEAAARRLGGPGEALGRALRIDGEEEIVDVVGIVADTRPSLYSRPEPVVYLPRNATYRPRATLYVRTSGDPTALIPTVRTLVRTLDPRLPLLSLEAAADLRHRLLAPWRLGYLAMGVLGSIAVLLAGAGLYGVLAYSVARRTREIGIRLAIGASRGAVVRMIVGRSLRVVALGLVAGFPLAAILAFLLRRMLFGVSPMDPWVYGEVGGLLLAVAVLAALLPARRAASVEPVRAMTE
jgi:predicted permease